MSVDLSMPVLVVDDYSTMVRIIRNLLRQVGFTNVDDASDGIGALRAAAREAVPAGHLRLEYGADVRLRIARRKCAPIPIWLRCPFIMITAESKTENVIAAKKAGVSNYIVKPFNAATLKAKIDAIYAPEPTFAE